ncbi:MAG: hypothetical protein K7J15_04125, partial [Candidatus Regiella insecticola]|nr:hypothetical protein [Candidatus Regiella insecticola]MCX2959532.1 hypothetical protein [Serratia symbiotica]
IPIFWNTGLGLLINEVESYILYISKLLQYVTYNNNNNNNNNNNPMFLPGWHIYWLIRNKISNI